MKYFPFFFLFLLLLSKIFFCRLSRRDAERAFLIADELKNNRRILFVLYYLNLSLVFIITLRTIFQVGSKAKNLFEEKNPLDTSF